MKVQYENKRNNKTGDIEQARGDGSAGMLLVVFPDQGRGVIRPHPGEVGVNLARKARCVLCCRTWQKVRSVATMAWENISFSKVAAWTGSVQDRDRPVRRSPGARCRVGGCTCTPGGVPHCTQVLRPDQYSPRNSSLHPDPGHLHRAPGPQAGWSK